MAALAMVWAHGACAAADTVDQYVTYKGTATALRSREFLYQEQHVLRSIEGKPAERVVLYTCRDGKAFARKTMSYGNAAFAPDFVLNDSSNGMSEGVRSAATGRSVFFRGSRGAAERSRALPQPTNLVADAGFDGFVRDQYPTLAAGKTMDLQFVVPSRLGVMGFSVQRVRGDRLGGTPVDVFRLQLAGMFGWFLPGIDVYYGARDRVLLRYVGLSDLRDPAGNNMKVNVLFDPKDRKPAQKTDLAAALAATIEPCR
ncbi:MAG: hypothetical protein NVSMB10_03820 [Steroidobacteraceae bacterium]